MTCTRPARGTAVRGAAGARVADLGDLATAVREKAVLVGVGPGIEEADLDELAALADSAGAEPVARWCRRARSPTPRLRRQGQARGRARAVHSNGAELGDLGRRALARAAPALEERLKVKVIDRPR